MARKAKAAKENTFLGEFMLDPANPEFKLLRGVCEPGNPWRCLIATAASMHLRRRMTVRLDHDKGAGVIGVTEGGSRYERPMTAEEVGFATKFDLGARMRKPLTVRVDLGDGTWKARPKSRRGGKDKPLRDGRQKAAKTIRERQLEAIKKAHASAVA